MIELIERTLVNGGDLEQARLALLNQANIDRQNRNNEIEHDYRIAILVRECLLTEPKGSSGYGCAKGILNRLREKYAGNDKETGKTVRKLMKAASEEEYQERKEQNDDGRSQENRQEERTDYESA